MNFSITQAISFDLLRRLSILNVMSDFLKKFFSNKNYGPGLTSFSISINCANPELLDPPKDFETGFLLNKKFTKAKRRLELAVKLNFREVSIASDDHLYDIITEAILKTYPHVESLAILDFHFDTFYADLREALHQREWIGKPNQPAFEFTWEGAELVSRHFSEEQTMPEDSFWNLIEEAKAGSEGNLYRQIEIITNILSEAPETDIVGFECTLRELIIRAYHYNAMAVQKVVEGSVDDDSFLYFRCKLILYGRHTFYNAINNPNLLVEKIDRHVTGEHLLSVADNAFKTKFGHDTDKLLPKEFVSEVIDYDSGQFKVQGEEWTEADLWKRYPKLWNMYMKV